MCSPYVVYLSTFNNLNSKYFGRVSENRTNLFLAIRRNEKFEKKTIEKQGRFLRFVLEKV